MFDLVVAVVVIGALSAIPVGLITPCPGGPSRSKMLVLCLAGTVAAGLTMVALSHFSPVARPEGLTTPAKAAMTELVGPVAELLQRPGGAHSVATQLLKEFPDAPGAEWVQAVLGSTDLEGAREEEEAEQKTLNPAWSYFSTADSMARSPVRSPVVLFRGSPGGRDPPGAGSRSMVDPGSILEEFKLWPANIQDQYGFGRPVLVPWHPGRAICTTYLDCPITVRYVDGTWTGKPSALRSRSPIITAPYARFLQDMEAARGDAALPGGRVIRIAPVLNPPVRSAPQKPPTLEDLKSRLRAASAGAGFPAGGASRR